MKKLITLSIFAMMLSFASYALDPISPSTGSVCIGAASLTLSDSLYPGGTWTSSNPSVATITSIGPGRGSLSGVSAGVVTITYTLGSSSVYGTYTVNTVPAPITGGTSPICVGATTTLSCATPGGTWTSYSSAATVGPSTGVVTGAYGGAALIRYTVGGCFSSAMVTVDATSAGGILGFSTVCIGGTITLTDSFSLGGTWSSGTPSIATIGASSGVVSGIAAGTAIITYATSGSCGSAYRTCTVTVTGTTTPGSIYGTTYVTVGSTINLYGTVTGGTWTSGATSIATISSTGLVSGIAVGTAPITYTVTGCSGPASTTANVTVASLDGISGNVNFGSGAYYGSVKVWLITYNTSTHSLAAYDSASFWSSGTSAHYSFTGLPTDSFRVKASLNDTSAGSGYIPTYHDNDFYWNNALVIYHTAGSSDINKDINMAYGTTTAGPGFIAGDVYTGANKGTSGSIPAERLHVCLVNSTTGQLVKQTFTDAAGHYSFASLPVGVTYNVFPDSLGFFTDAYTSISLTATNPTMTAASFTMHTVSKTITPHTQRVNAVGAAASSVLAFPNPASNKIYISWNTKATEEANIVIADVAGRVLYSNTVSMTAGTGINTIDVSSLANGLYVVSVKTATISYSNKLQVQH